MARKRGEPHPPKAKGKTKPAAVGGMPTKD